MPGTTPKDTTCQRRLGYKFCSGHTTQRQTYRGVLGAFSFHSFHKGMFAMVSRDYDYGRIGLVLFLAIIGYNLLPSQSFAQCDNGQCSITADAESRQPIMTTLAATTNVVSNVVKVPVQVTRQVFKVPGRIVAARPVRRLFRCCR